MFCATEKTPHERLRAKSVSVNNNICLNGILSALLHLGCAIGDEVIHSI